MPSPAQILTHGAREEQIGPLRWRLRRNDFDSCFMSIDSTNPAFVVPGSPLPDLPHMRAVDVQPEQQGDDWLFSNTEYKGFRDPQETWRIFARSRNSPSEGFDNISLVVGTREPGHARFSRGQTLPQKDDLPTPYPHMWIQDVVEEDTDIQNEAGVVMYSQLNLQLRGLLGPKPYTRRSQCASQTITPDVNWTMYDSINELGETINGWSAEGSRPAEISIAKLVLTDSFVTLTEPPFGGIPGNITPENAPDYTDLTFWTSGSYRYYWPFGWRRASLQSEQIPGRECWAWSVSYEFQQKILPG